MNETVLQEVMPELPVSDIRAAIAHYRNIFGFTTDFVNGDPPVYAILKRNDIRIALLSSRPDAPPGTGRLYAFVENLDRFYETCKEAGAKIIEPLANRPYGMKDCAILDLDGNRLAFGEQLNEPASG